MTSENTKCVTTSIPYDIWRLAAINKVSWSIALRLGIESMAGLNQEKKALLDERDKTEARIRYINDRLEKIDKEEKEKKKKDKENVVLEFDLNENQVSRK